MFRRVILTTALCAALAAPASAAAADETVAADPRASQVTALRGTLVWVSGAPGAQTLMRRTGTTVERVPGAPVAPLYRSVDLGLDRSGELVLTYRRCRTAASCSTLADDLAGTRRSIRAPRVARCVASTAPAVWRGRSVFGMACRTPSGGFDAARSGLYVQSGSGTPRRLPLPREARRHGSTDITAVDLRGTRAAAIAADIYHYAFSVETSGRSPRAFLAAASEGETSAAALGLALGSGGSLWALATSEHAGDPNEAIVYRQRGACVQFERLANASPQELGFRALDVAVDGATAYLAVPGTGIVRHDFTPAHACP